MLLPLPDSQGAPPTLATPDGPIAPLPLVKGKPLPLAKVCKKLPLPIDPEPIAKPDPEMGGAGTNPLFPKAVLVPDTGAAPGRPQVAVEAPLLAAEPPTALRAESLPVRRRGPVGRADGALDAVVNVFVGEEGVVPVCEEGSCPGAM